MYVWWMFLRLDFGAVLMMCYFFSFVFLSGYTVNFLEFLRYGCCWSRSKHYLAIRKYFILHVLTTIIISCAYNMTLKSILLLFDGVDTCIFCKTYWPRGVGGCSLSHTHFLNKLRSGLFVWCGISNNDSVILGRSMLLMKETELLLENKCSFVSRFIYM